MIVRVERNHCWPYCSENAAKLSNLRNASSIAAISSSRQVFCNKNTQFIKQRVTIQTY